MSTKIQGTFSKTLATLMMLSTALSMAGFAAAPIVAHAVAPADYGLHEGDTISAVSSNDPDIYIVNDWGYKRLFVNPAIFTLYGHLSWAGVKSVSASTRDAFITSGLFRNCETNAQAVYGIEVVSEDVANLHWINITGDQAVAQDPNFFKKVFCINSREQALYGVGADYTSLAQVPNYARGQVGPVVNGNVSVSLASDNPASNTLIATQSAADLAHFAFTGSGAVTSVILQRTGVSSDTTLTNVYLYQGSKRLTDAATVSQGKITFSDTNGLFTVSGTSVISVKADIADSTSGQTVGVSLTGVNGNAVSLAGNLFTIATAPSDLATVAVGAPTPASTLTLDPQNDYTMWQSTVTIGNHDAWLKSMQLRIIGSVLPGDLRNFRLYADGVQIGSVAQQDSNGYLTFDFGAGVTLKTGGRVIKLIGDVVGGSNRNFIVSLRQKTDISVVDSQYGVGILPTGTFPATAPTQTLGTEVQAINQGTLTITKTNDSASGNIIKDATSVSLVKYKFEAHGEALKFDSLRASFTASPADWGSLRNAAIYVDGAQIGSIQSLCEDNAGSTASCSAYVGAYTTFNLGSSLVVQPGTPRIVEIRADIYDNTGTNHVSDGDTVIAQIIAGSSNVQRMTSLNYFSNTAATVGNTLTVKTGTFAAAKYTGYANQSVVVPASQFKIGQYTLTAASSEDVNVNTITVDVASVSANEVTDAYIVVTSDTGATVYTSSPKSSLVSTSSGSYSVNFTIPKTKTYQVAVYANLQSKLATETFSTNMDAAGLTAASSTSVTATQATGQSITGANGSLNLANGANPASALVNGGTTKSVYVFTLQPQYDNFFLDDASFNLSSVVASSTGAIGMAYLMDGSNVIGSSPITSTTSGSMDFSGMNFPIPQSGGTKTLTVQVALSNVGVGANDTGGNVTVRLSHLKYRSSSGGITTSVVNPATYTGNQFRVVKAFPTFSNVSLPSTVLAAGTQTLFKTNVSATGGAVVWRKVVFNIAVTANPTINAFQLFVNNVDVTNLASATVNYGKHYATQSRDFNVAAAAGSGQLIFMFNTDQSIPANGSAAIELRGNVGGTLVAGQAISTSIANTNGSTFVASDDVYSLGGSAISGWRTDIDPTFLWSDSSAPTHSDTTDDWMGDGLVTGLGQSQALYQ